MRNTLRRIEHSPRFGWAVIYSAQHPSVVAPFTVIAGVRNDLAR